jgi:hypothetical protein
MTAPDLVAEYRRLAAAATDGPWRHSTPRPWTGNGGIWSIESTANVMVTHNADEGDLALIVWLRNNADAMADEIERLRAGAGMILAWHDAITLAEMRRDADAAAFVAALTDGES